MKVLPSVQREDLLSLLADYCDGNLTADGAMALESTLAESDEAKQLYVEYLNIHFALNKCFSKSAPGSELDSAEKVDGEVQQSSNRLVNLLGRLTPVNRTIVWTTLAASVLFACYFAAISWNMWGRENSSHQPIASLETDAPSKPSVAKISDAYGAVWSLESAAKWHELAVAVGEPLKIESGVVRMTLMQGTMLSVQGPAEWSIDGNNEARLTRGKMFAHVPSQATGFTLDTPTAHIVDLGTEFGTEVSQSGETTLQVVKGEVQFAQNTESSKPQTLVAGEAVHVTKTADGTAVVEKIPFDAKQATIKPPADPLDRWHATSEKLRTDPSLVAYYDFQSKGATLKNVLADKLHGEIITTRDAVPWTDGRWHGKQALAFGKDFATVSIPNDPALQRNGDWSFAVWFRTDQVPGKGKYALIVGKGVLPTRSYTLWINDHSWLHISANDSKGTHRVCRTEKVIQKGEWTLAVGVFAVGKMHFYINGQEACAAQPISDSAPDDGQPLKIGGAREAKYDHPFTGVIDELAIFKHPLNAEEIAEMYRAGNPER